MLKDDKEPLVPRRDLCLINYSNQYIKGQKRELEEDGMEDIKEDCKKLIIISTF
jgi:hypothetical protein